MTDTTASAPALPPLPDPTERTESWRDEYGYEHWEDAFSADQMRAYAAEAVRAALASRPVAPAVPVAVVYVREPRAPNEHGRWVSWLTNPADLSNETMLYAAAPDTASASRDGREGRNVGNNRPV